MTEMWAELSCHPLGLGYSQTEVRGLRRTLAAPKLLMYKRFGIDTKPVGISYLGAFLITNGSCVMMPIMSVQQQGGCCPSHGIMLQNKTEEFPPPLLSMAGFCLPHHLSVFVCGVLVP